MDAKYLAEIKAREQSATPGPWKWKKDVLAAPAPRYVVIKPFFEDAPERVTICILPNDMKFISHARTDIPALLAEVERLTDLSRQNYCKFVRQQEDNAAKDQQIATLTRALNEAIRKSQNALSLVKTDAKIIQGLHKCPNSKVEILYARDLAAKIEECADFVKEQLTPAPDEVTHGQAQEQEEQHGTEIHG